MLTVGSFQAGDANNVIPDTATLKVNIRWFEPEVREQLIAGIKRVTDAIAVAADVPKDRMPRYIMKGQLRPGHQRRRSRPPRRARPPPGPRRGQGRARPADADGLRGFSRPRLAPPHHQDPARPHRLRPGRRRGELKKGIRPAPNHNAKFKVELPTIAAGTKADIMVLMEFLKKP